MLKDIIQGGIYSACTANSFVLGAVMEKALETGQHVLIEATANQVNQDGGYTGMKPVDFVTFVHEIAAKIGFPLEKLILGGDHLGPLTWQKEPADVAMEKAETLIIQYVKAGFIKIHLDTSMPLPGDPKGPNTALIAERGARLCAVAEKAFAEYKESHPEALPPVYVVGSEVPIPGGAQEEEEGLQVTRPADLEETVETFRTAFEKLGLTDAWDRVIAVVVQPGVEFGSDVVHEYNREAAKVLTSTLKKYPNLVFEGHSTDYQTPQCLSQMVEDGIRILKVGPALTFALREGLFALAHMEKELLSNKPDLQLSNFIEVLDEVMVAKPNNWKSHYHGTAEAIEFQRKYSLSDRCRYYLPEPSIQKAIDQLISNLSSVDIPLTLLSQYLPEQYKKIRACKLKNHPTSLLKDRIVSGCIDDYVYATK